MKQARLVLLSFAILFAACSPGVRERLIGSWRADSVQKASMDSFFQKSQRYIDTVGKNNDPETNMRLYGVTNMDSVRRLLQQQFDSAKALQINAVTNTVFKFRKDSVAVLSFNGNLDSSKWSVENNNTILMQDMNGGKAEGDRVKMDILVLTDKMLKVKLVEDTEVSIVTFHPEGK